MDKLSIERVLEALGADNIKSTGSDYLMCSCLHAPYSNAHSSGYDRNPSMRIKSTDDGSQSYYSCFSCGNHGTIKELVIRLGNLRKVDYTQVLNFIEDTDSEFFMPSFDQLVEKHRKKLDLNVTPIEPNPKFIPMNDSYQGMKYLNHRGIQQSGIDKARLQFDNYEQRIVFPVIGNDQLLYGYTSRAAIPDKYFPTRKCRVTKQWDFGSKLPLDETYEPFYMDDRDKKVSITYEKIRDYKGLRKQMHIIGMHLWDTGKPVFIVEGLFGYLHLLSIGADQYFNIGSTMGASISDYQVERLRMFGKPVYILFDNDKAGRIAMFGTDKKQGAISKLEHKVNLFLPKWPKCSNELSEKIEKYLLKNEVEILENKVYKGYTKVYGKWYKADPDRLTLEEVEQIKLKSEMV